MQEIANSDCDTDCLEMGCRWSIIYTMCGILLCLIAINSFILTIGAW